MSVTTKIGIKYSDQIVHAAIVTYLKEKLTDDHLQIVEDLIEDVDILITDDHLLVTSLKTRLSIFITQNEQFKFSDNELQLKKPFKVEALILPIKNVLKRHQEVQIANSNVLFMTLKKKIRDIDSQKEINLTDKESQILLTLNECLGEVVSKEQLLKHIWKYHEGIDTHTLETHIYRLRQKLDQFNDLKKKLVTLENGYQLNPVD